MTGSLEHSPEYLKRQADRAVEIAHWRERETQWTDAQFLAEYAAQKRNEAKGQAAMIEQQGKEDPDSEAYIRKYGTDEG